MLVAHGQNLVDEINLPGQRRGDREKQTGFHTGRIGVDGIEEIVSKFGEVTDLAQELDDLASPRPVERQPSSREVLSRQEVVASDSELVDRRHRSRDPHRPGGWAVHPPQRAQQRALTRAVAAQDAQELTRTDLKCHVPKRGEALRGTAPEDHAPDRLTAQHDERLAQLSTLDDRSDHRPLVSRVRARRPLGRPTRSGHRSSP